MIVVDLDGTILEGRERHYACYRRILTSFGAKPLELEAYWEHKRSQRDRRALLRQSGVEARYEEFMTLWLQTIEDPELLALDRPHPGALQALQQLRARGRELALVTSRKHEHRLLLQLDAKGLSGAFDAVICARDADTGERKAAAFTRAIAAPRARCEAWIGDTEVDLRAAKALGATALAVACGLRTREYLLAEGAADVYDDLAQLVRSHSAYPIGSG